MEVADENYDLDINPNEVCRLCLSHSANLLNIYSNSIVDGYIISVSDMLSFTVDIAMVAGDKLPNKICADCKKQIITFYTFKQKTKRTEQSLLFMFKRDSIPKKRTPTSETDGKIAGGEEFTFDTNFENSNEGSGIKLNEDDMLAIEEAANRLPLKRPSPRVLPTHAAKKRAIEKSAAISAMVIKTESDAKEMADASDDNSVISADEDDQSGSESANLYECQICSEQFTEEFEFANHCKEHNDIGYHCMVCGDLFSDEDQFMAHECEVNEGEFLCVPCDKRLKSSAQLHQHNKMHDSMGLIIQHIEFYPCHDCCLLFISKENLIKHNIETHKVTKGSNDDEDDDDDTFKKIDEKQNDYKDEAYSCGECGTTCSTIYELKNHVISHAKKFPCPIYDCGCQYDQLSRLKIHVLNKHINEKNMQCLHCSLAFPTYDDLQAHLKNNFKEKKFKCYECGKFNLGKDLAHLQTLKDKKYKCHLCSKTFKQQGEFKTHLRSHTNERPFQCTICDKTYKTSSVRAAHMDSHIKGKTFECTLCNKKLQSRNSYRGHMKRHTEEKKHECEHCKKRFFTRSHLKIHQSKMHRDASTDDTVLEEGLEPQF